jgi:hypothetical protein
VIKFVSDLRQVSGFLRVSFTNKTDRHDITEILLKVALNTITPPNRNFSKELNLKKDSTQHKSDLTFKKKLSFWVLVSFYPSLIGNLSG